jgi:hypothetical protein
VRANIRPRGGESPVKTAGVSLPGFVDTPNRAKVR